MPRSFVGKKRILAILIALICVASPPGLARAQLLRRVPEALKERAIPQVPSELGQRGIEKKDIRRNIPQRNVRVAVLYDATEVPEAHAAAVAGSLGEESLTRVLQAVTAPTARSSGSPLPGPNQVIFISAKQNEENCDKPGCVKSEAGCFCYRLLDIDKTVLTTTDDSVPPLQIPPKFQKGSATGGTGGRLVSQPGIVVVVMGDTFPQKLASPEWRQRNQQWLEEEVWSKIKASPLTTNLTIKTKSPR